MLRDNAQMNRMTLEEGYESHFEGVEVIFAPGIS